MYLLLCIIDKDQVVFFPMKGVHFHLLTGCAVVKKKVQKHFRSRFNDATENML